MRGEIPHKKGPISPGRFPVKASKYFIKVIKNLKGTASHENLDLDSIVIKIAKADRASKPPRLGRFSRSGKSTHILLIAEESEKIRTSKKQKPNQKTLESKSEEKKHTENKKETKKQDQQNQKEQKQQQKEGKQENTIEKQQQTDKK